MPPVDLDIRTTLRPGWFPICWAVCRPVDQPRTLGPDYTAVATFGDPDTARDNCPAGCRVFPFCGLGPMVGQDLYIDCLKKGI